ncbi:HD-GYP domain-containing protein [Bacillus sp. AGMB 02131]|uniref:HD-GYP domain-containing protein n=1 Tax=Peribacillus faecalis TaxID=2772559 RepID=A0A927CW26_9BACI|nr:HD-GYP domain-containing protein [Peribacillus faecalis]MBD3108214.1 HD-GYP domain-containing protein [Peribacillus faecalis]
MGTILHDVGKLKVPREILMKPGELADEEFAIIKKHTEYGFVILKEVKTIPLVVALCAYQHHERLDGTGYPQGLKDEDIHYYAKIIAVADVFDAITSNRVYREAMLPHEGLEILYAGCGRLFDLQIVEAFRSAVAIYPVGVTVELSNRTVGIVKKQNIGLGDRPIIEIIEEDGKKLSSPYVINLSEKLDIVVTGCVIV